MCATFLPQELRERVLRGKYRIPFYMSTDCENLLKKFLILNPTKRGTLEVRGVPGVVWGALQCSRGTPSISWHGSGHLWSTPKSSRHPQHNPSCPWRASPPLKMALGDHRDPKGDLRKILNVTPRRPPNVGTA